jgi:aminoglycoside/choline kinase family phosphotransferase
MSALPNIPPDRSDAMDAFLAHIGWEGATRSVLAGDASFRRYERVQFGERIAVLMDAPPPWEDVRPFMAVTALLATCGARVPAVIASDEAKGFLLLEDLGDASFSRVLRADPAREPELYAAATDALVRIVKKSKAHAPILETALAPYDDTIYLREAALMADWFLPQVHGMARAKYLREEYLSLWRDCLGAVPLQRACLVHRDYHADNLLWLEGATGADSVAMIDYQDALWGDAAYDLASLLEDARRDVAPATVGMCIERFVGGTGEAVRDFSLRYAIIAAQRNAKIIGIFTRLCVRDGKAHYLDFLPRVWANFSNDIAHPALAPIRAFIDREVPLSWRGSFAADTSIGGLSS